MVDGWLRSQSLVRASSQVQFTRYETSPIARGVLDRHPIHLASRISHLESRIRVGGWPQTRYNGAQHGERTGLGGSMQVLEGHLDAQGLRFALVVSRFNEALTTRLESGAVDCLQRHGAEEDHITIVRVPGAWEIPLVAAKLAADGEFDAVISVGALVRGGTAHFDLLAAEVAKGVAQAAITSGVPMTFGVITADTLEQAVERAGTKMGNKGWEAALAAIEMARLSERLDRRR
jgi:6,7-dimethyl-8-ribityllumazine synthase